jgi:phage terminase small subunit
MPRPKLKPHKTPRPNRRDLLRYRNFAEAYSAFGSPTFQNAYASAIKAGYSEAYARGDSYKFLDKPGVQKEMERIRDLRLKRSTIMSPEELLEALTTEARTLPNQLVDETGKVLPLHQMSRQQAHAIAGVEYKTRSMVTADGKEIIEEKVKYKLTDRQKSKDMLAKYHGIYEKDNEQQKPDEPVRFVMMPSGDLTLAEWTRQVEELNEIQAKAKAATAKAAA